MDLLQKSDEEILEIASPLWDNLIICSNSQDYFGFTKDFSARMLLVQMKLSSQNNGQTTRL